MNYEEQYHCYSGLVEQALERALVQESCPQQKVEDAMRYSLLGGGKRLRGVLVLACCEQLGGRVEDALPLACAVEMVHAYSLIHDDLPCMDNDDLRRGKPTCHIQYGEAVAVLAGDALLTRAFEMITATACTLGAQQKVQACALLAKAAGSRGMIGGQVIDIEHEGLPMEKALLDTLHSLKTGALIRASAALGCCAAGCSVSIASGVDHFAACLGLVFQIVDDLLDETATLEELGKPIGSDAQNGKTTYCTLYGMQMSWEIVQRLTDEAVEALTNLPAATFLQELARQMAVRTK